MAQSRVRAAGGLAAVRYVFQKGREAGGLLALYRRLRSRNTCKTCALGMGGQSGGMVNEAGHFPEVCKKSVQAQAGDMGRVIDESFFADTSIAEMARFTSARMERLGRLTFPVLAGPEDRKYRRIGWDEAMERAATALKTSPPAEVFFYASGRSSNEAAFLFQLVARAFGTANIHNCSYYCHSASGVALGKVYGSGTASVVLDDLAQADLAVVAGANPASNHPRLITQLVHLRRRGGKVIVINPLRELGLVRFRVPSDVRSMLFGSRISDLYVQPHIGGDLALFVGVLKTLCERDALDHEFIGLHTQGYDTVRAQVESCDWDTLIKTSGVSRAEIDRMADLLAASRRGIFLWAMGLTHHAHGTDSILALANIALARGWLGRPGTGLLPIRGHSNVQGVGSVGVSPGLKREFADRLGELYDIHPSTEAGQDTYASMLAAEAGKIQAAVLLGGNLFASNPDRAWAGAALRRVGTTIALTTKLNEGHVHGRGRTSLILPVLARDEESQWTTQESMFNFVRLSEGGQPAVEGEMRSEVKIIADLAERILPPGRFDWSEIKSHAALRKAIGKVVPGYEASGRIDRDKKEFLIAGRTFHTPEFATPDGRARFSLVPLTGLAVGSGEFRLMTLRSEGQFNTVVYDEEDLYRGNDRRDVVMMSGADAKALQVGEGDRVIVETAAGRMAVSVAMVDIRPGNLAMYYPEANELVARILDPQSRTPAFKSVTARIIPVRST